MAEGPSSNTSPAAGRNRETYNRIWGELAPFIRYNPGARHRRRILFSLIDELPKKSVIDVGCGNGELLRMLRARYPQIEEATGADLSDAVVSANRRAWPELRFEVLDLENGALPQQAELVTCTEVIEHLDHRERAFGHLASMVAPGGALALTCPTGKVHATERHFGHTTHPDVAELVELGRGAGLELVRAHNWGFPLYRLTKWATNLDPELSLRNFAVEHYGPAQVLISQLAYWANFLNLPSSPLGVQLFALFRRPK
ncbi:MAG: class I SAM-dependent methyltransferase [Deltaproteobacteria bacterium]|nr:class I SAM-dependent methyltransferase [Deltaproteobacteria bacterium]